MTEEQQKALITELIGIREGMATKADLLKLETGLGDALIRIFSAVEDLKALHAAALPDSSDSNRQNAANDSPYREELTRLTERVDRLYNWYHQDRERIDNLDKRIDRLAEMTTEYGARLQIRIATLETTLSRITNHEK